MPADNHTNRVNDRLTPTDTETNAYMDSMDSKNKYRTFISILNIYSVMYNIIGMVTVVSSDQVVSALGLIVCS